MKNNYREIGCIINKPRWKQMQGLQFTIIKGKIFIYYSIIRSASV